MDICTACSAPLPDGARFCPACGHEVLGHATEERRVVTVLFADLVGYTSLSEHLDPERVKRFIDAAFQRLIADIEAYGGHVDKVLGDGILALFGAPVAHEDDAERAIRAGMQMHETLAAFVREQPDLETPLQLRIGVNTGEVLVGAITGTADYTAMGDVVNVASRLQSLAEPGGILIGDSTAALTSDEIVREPLDDVAVRGRVQSERVWRIIGRQRRLPMIGTRSDLPFVGRANQRKLLASVMAIVAGGRGAVVAVSGEAGIGKTRLVNEALERFPSRDVTIYAGECAPFGETNVWSPIATALFRMLDLDARTPTDELRETCRRKGVELYGFHADDPVLDRFVDGVMHLLGHPSELDRLSPSRARETLFSLVIEGIRRRSRTGPVVLWIDDLQWADVLIIELLRRIAKSMAERPVLVITAQRDDADIEWPSAIDHPVTVRIPLDSLSHDEAAELIGAIRGDEESAPALVDQLYERSGGNPLFLAELTELMVSNPDSTALPGSLRALIAARLDRLTSGERAILDNAAVLGASGLVSSLEKFAAEMGQHFSDDDLQMLAGDGLLDIADGQWRFRSDVVREVAYQTLTKLARAQRHAGTASVMATNPIMSRDEIAHHAATAAELIVDIGPVPGVPADIVERAAELLRDATRRALEVGAFHQAVRIATRGLDLGAIDESVARELLLLRAQAATEPRSAEHAHALADIGDALDAALAAGDRRHEGIARRLRGILHQHDGDLDGARRELGASVEIFRDLGDDVELAVSLRERGLAEVFGGSLEDAEWLLGEAESLSERLNDRRGRAWVRQHQAWVAFLSGDTELAESRLLMAADEFADLDDRFGRGWALGLLAYVRFFQRRFDEAESLAVKVRADAVELGDRWAPAMMDSLIASIRLWTSRFSEAEEYSRRALHDFREINDRFGMVQALAPRVRALIALGRTHEAERSLEEALSLGDSFGNLSFPAMAAAGAAVHLGLGPRAVVIGESAVERAILMGGETSEAKVTLALAMCQIGRPDEALASLVGIHIESPYSRAVHAIAAAMTGSISEPLADAEAVWNDAGSSYLDRVLVDVAAAAAESRSGEPAAAARRLERARSTARLAGDVVARALTGCASVALVGEGDRENVDHLNAGWHRVIEGLAGIDPHASPAGSPAATRSLPAGS